MANNKIQIKRSATTATPASLSAGELAFSNVTGGSGVLFIGSTDGGTVVPVGGVRNPGTLTANQALVANSTSGIDKIITANLTLGGTSVGTINAVANLTHLGTPSNTELATSWAVKTYVDTKTAAASNPQGANGEFQYNNSGVLAGTNNMVYDNTTGRITVGNSTVNVQLGYTGTTNALAHFHGNQNAYVQVILNNVNSGLSASSDYVLENDLGTETTNFLDLGINSSNYNDANFSAMGAGEAYLYSQNSSIVVGTANGGAIKFITNGTTSADIRAVVTAGGNVGIGNTAPNARLQVTGTANISGLTTVTANLVLGAGLTANGGGGTAGHVLTSGGTGNVYWAAAAATVAGSNSQVQFNANGTLAGDAGFTYDGVTDTLSVAGAVNVGANVVVNTTTVYTGNSTVNATHNSALLQVANSTTIANVTAAGLIVYSNSTVNASHNSALLQVANSTSITNVVATGLQVYTNSTVNSTVTASLVQVSNSTATANITALGLTSGISVVNTVQVSVGANIYANATTVFAGNSTVNASHTSSLVQVSNSTSTANLTAADLKIGATTTVNSSQITATLFSGALTGSYANISGQVNTATLYAATSANIASAVQANSTGVWTTGTVNAASHTTGTGYGAAGATVNTTTIGVSTNSTVNATVTSGLVQVSNSTGTANLTAVALTIGTTVTNSTGLTVGANVTVNATAFDVGNTVISTTNAVFGGTIAANGGIGSSGQALISGGAANVFWATIGNGTVTSVASGNGITGGTITSTGTLYVTEGVGLAVNTTGVHVKANSGIIANSTGTFVAANTTGGLLANSTLQVKIGTGLVFDGSGNVAVNASALSFTDLTVSGNLTVLGDLVSLNVATLSVEDSLITLAKDQASTTTYTDAVDVGFIAPYGNTLTANANWTGLFRDQSDNGIYKLFAGNIPAPTSTVDTTNVNFAFATLQAQLRAGGTGASALIANSSHVNITANSTTNVFITANTLSLSTALPVTSGGTGLNSVAVGDLLVGNSTNTLTRLASGADGYVLQINGTGVVAWNTLDGGTF